MPYEKTEWKPGEAPGISAPNLNKLETQYEEAVADAAVEAQAKVNAHATLATHLVSGLIAMWHGLIANIPSGWVICDGNNNTPNLLAKFVEGVATVGTNPGATGGALSKTTAGHTHSGPSHTHSVTVLSEPAAGGPVDVGRDGTYTTSAAGTGATGSKTDSIADIRPPFYDVAFIMKT